MVQNELHEREKRRDLIIGILLSTILAFIASIIGNISYDIFFKEIIKFSELNPNAILLLVLSLIAIIGFLSFFVQDYQNEASFDKHWIKRFIEFFFRKFTLGIILRWIYGIYLILFLFIGIIILMLFGGIIILQISNNLYFQIIGVGVYIVLSLIFFIKKFRKIRKIF